MKDSKQLRQFKRQMKRNPTRHEAVASELLVSFELKKQVILGFYILDLVVLKKLLVVEVDGSSHEGSQSRAYDQRRDSFIQKCGLRVVHIKNREVAKILRVVHKFGDEEEYLKRFRSALGRANAERSRAIIKIRKQQTQPFNF